MLFNSVHFLIFFPAVTALFFLLRGRARIFLLLAASCAFYMAFVPEYILILGTTILVDYGAGLRIEAARGRARRAWMLASLLITCAILFLFKYFDFASGAIGHVLAAFGSPRPMPVLAWALPIGLSFHTFQSLSYVFEVYLGRQKAERDFPTYALYVMFYPQLVAGPIERPQNLLPQFRAVQGFDAERIKDGLRLMLWGFLKKILIADRLSILVDQVYGDPSKYGGPALALATVAFAFEIYCDFSGYSDIAIGAARVMGFRLMRNFDNPYLSRSVSEFWRRWHISLSTWFRDYLYLPLGGGRAGRARKIGNLLLVFAVSGLWHGAAWTYLAWGLLNGAFLAAALFTSGPRRRLAEGLGLASRPALHRALSISATFLLICFTWIFFRAACLADARYIVGHLGTGWGGLPALALAPGGAAAWEKAFGMGPCETALAFAAMGLVMGLEAMEGKGSLRSAFFARPLWARLSAYTLALWSLLLFGAFSGARFIYFTF